MTRSGRLSTLDTVDTETPAAAATSWIRAGRAGTASTPLAVAAARPGTTMAISGAAQYNAAGVGTFFRDARVRWWWPGWTPALNGVPGAVFPGL
ncbi:hypothetical protein GCM10010104_29920 [Streptomyces indiaensis]|uniref:Uncharacterized protein n=1 Tax=Streptomyces indiaensis TaxID=284033 RepID=A0ABN3DJL5_9ACTN